MTRLDPLQAHIALTEQFAAGVSNRDALRLSGSDVSSYLQGQLSQDVDAILDGESKWSWLLQPHGKVDALVRVSRRGDEFYLDVDGGYGKTVEERLSRFLIRVDVAVEAMSWSCISVRGPGADQAAIEGELVAPLAWSTSVGYDVFGEGLSIPEATPEVDADALEVLRIESGFPAMGKELDEKTIPAEAGANDRTVSFTKGCYTGQELVARIDARGGNVPRHLRLIVIEGTDVFARGAQLHPVGAKPNSAKPLGTITSSVYSAAQQATICLGYIRRDMASVATAIAHTDEGQLECRVQQLASST